MRDFFGGAVREYRGKIVMYAVLQLLYQGILLLPPYCYLLFLNEIMTAQRFELLWLVVLLFCLVFLAKTFVSVLVRRVRNGIFPCMQAEWKRRALQRYGSLDIEVLQGYTAGELKERLHRDTEKAVQFCEKELELWISVLNIAVTATVLLYLNWILAAVSFLLQPLSFLVTRYIKGRSNLEYGRLRKLQGEYNDLMIHNMYFRRSRQTAWRKSSGRSLRSSGWIWGTPSSGRICAGL